MFCLKGIGGGSDDKKGKPREGTENKMVIIIERKTGEKMGTKEEIQSQKSLEKLAPTPPPHTPIPFVGPVCALTLILPWSHPTGTVLTSTYLPVPSLKDIPGRERKEGGRERGKKEGDFCS